MSLFGLIHDTYLRCLCGIYLHMAEARPRKRPFYWDYSFRCTAIIGRLCPSIYISYRSAVIRYIDSAYYDCRGDMECKQAE